MKRRIAGLLHRLAYRIFELEPVEVLVDGRVIAEAVMEHMRQARKPKDEKENNA